MCGSFGLREGVRAQGFIPDELHKQAAKQLGWCSCSEMLVNLTVHPAPAWLSRQAVLYSDIGRLNALQVCV